MLALVAKVVPLLPALWMVHSVAGAHVRGVVVSLPTNSLSLVQVMGIILHFFSLTFPRFAFLACLVLFEFLLPATLQPVQQVL